MVFINYKHKDAAANGNSNGASYPVNASQPFSSSNRLNGAVVLPTADVPVIAEALKSPSEKIKNPWEVVKQSAVDDR